MLQSDAQSAAIGSGVRSENDRRSVVMAHSGGRVDRPGRPQNTATAPRDWPKHAQVSFFFLAVLVKPRLVVSQLCQCFFKRAFARLPWCPATASIFSAFCLNKPSSPQHPVAPSLALLIIHYACVGKVRSPRLGQNTTSKLSRTPFAPPSMN